MSSLAPGVLGIVFAGFHPQRINGVLCVLPGHDIKTQGQDFLHLTKEMGSGESLRKEQTTMNGGNSGRGWCLKLVAAALLGLMLISLAAQPAESAPWRGRGWARGWGGYRAYRMPYRNYARAYPRYAYRAPVPRYYSSNYFYRGAAPYGYGYGGYTQPIAPGFGYYNYAPPMY
jgi:hypothetical protein